MKKFINKPENIETEMLDGLVKAYPELLERIKGTDVIARTNKKNGKVALVSGGGSGHEPAHVGFVGYGLLDAAVPGAIYTSPTPDQIYSAIKEVDSGKGTLLIVKNYTGDVMNFEMAKDIASSEGINLEEVIVQDDVALPENHPDGRRGVAGTIFVHKIAGAKAEEGASLEEVKDIAQRVSDNVRSMGVAIEPSVMPGVDKPSFPLENDEIEMGIGIHGEPGVQNEAFKSADEITEELVNNILNDKDFRNADVALLVNGSGATPLMELFIVARKALELLKENDVRVQKTLVGNYMTSLNQAGVSISLLKLDKDMLDLLEKPAESVSLTIREQD